MYHIRFHGRGGQGVKTASNILGRAFFGEGFEIEDAYRHGTERRGAPVYAYVRAARGPINERSLIAHPGLVVVADESMVASSAAGVLLGVSARTVMLINTLTSARTWKERLNLPGVVLTMPPAPDLPACTDDATLSAINTLMGTICAGAAARLCGVIGRQTLERAVYNELGALPRPVIERNSQSALFAYDAMQDCAGIVAETADDDLARPAAPEWADLPRTLRPVIDYEICNRCSWICGTLCPDSVISMDAGRAPHIDYERCKGCMMCKAVCPAHAVSAVLEREQSMR